MMTMSSQQRSPTRNVNATGGLGGSSSMLDGGESVNFDELGSLPEDMFDLDDDLSASNSAVNDLLQETATTDHTIRKNNSSSGGNTDALTPIAEHHDEGNPTDDSIKITTGGGDKSNTNTSENTGGTTGTAILQPNENDVLLGRGGKNNQWSGNEKLRTLAREMSSAYAGAPKRNKPAIAWMLVTKMRALQPSGRFLKQEQVVGEWYEVHDDVAREKASQCLRDIVAVLAKGKVAKEKPKNKDQEPITLDGNSILPQPAASGISSNNAAGGNNAQTAATVEQPPDHQFSMPAPPRQLSSQQQQQLEPTPFSAATQSFQRSSAAQAGLNLLRGGTGSNATINNSGPGNTMQSMKSNPLLNRSLNPGMQGSRGNTSNAVISNAMQSMQNNPVMDHAMNSSFQGNLGGSNNDILAPTPIMDHAMNSSFQGLPRSTSSAAQAGLNMLRGNHGSNANFNNNNNAMQTSSMNLQGMQQQQSNQIMFNNRGNASFANGPSDRKRCYASAPDLGGISAYMAKRRRGQLNGIHMPSSAMRNATFTTSQQDGLEPEQIEQQQQQRMPPMMASMMQQRQMTGKSISCVTLGGGGKSISCMNLGATPQVNQQSASFRDPLLHRLHNLKANHSNNFNSNNNHSQANATFSLFNNNNNNPDQMDEETNYLSTHQEQEEKSYSCFTGMGAAMGEDDDTALQRWIDRMAEEELS